MSAPLFNRILNSIRKLNIAPHIPTATAIIEESVTLTEELKITLSSLIFNNSEFELSDDGGIVCPYTGTLSVTMSGMFSPRNGYIGFTIYCNSDSILDYYEPAGSQTYGCISSANNIVEVEAGDILYFYVKSSNTADILVKNDKRSRITVTYIEADID